MASSKADLDGLHIAGHTMGILPKVTEPVAKSDAVRASNGACFLQHEGQQLVLGEMGLEEEGVLRGWQRYMSLGSADQNQVWTMDDGNGRGISVAEAGVACGIDEGI